MGMWEIVVPETTTNLITNPSFEKATTGWTQGTGWTLTRQGTHQWRGGYSGRMAASGTSVSNTLTYAFTAPAAGSYVFSAWVKDTGCNWANGTVLRLAVSGALATNTYNHTYIKGTSEVDEWTYLETLVTIDASDLTVSIIVYATAAPTSGYYYLDAFQVEQKAYATTYCDGDEPGCSWNGAEHGSTSTRSAQSRMGGRVYDLDDLDITVIEGGNGAGMPPITQKTQSTALMAGAQYLGFKVQPRTFTILGAFIEESTLEELHKARAALINAIKPDLVKGAQPFKMRYTGGDEVLEITCVYDAGLEFSNPRCDTERFALRVIAYDPMWYSLYDTAAHVTSTSSATERYIHAKIDGAWSTAITPSAGDSVYAIAIDKRNGRVYIGGSFQNLDGVGAADHIAYWDTAAETWNAVKTGANDRVLCIAIAPNGDLYIGGDFTTVDGVATGRIAYYDLSADTWYAMGSGLGDIVYDIAIDTNGAVYATGLFTTGGGVVGADGIAKWSGGAWSALGTGINNFGSCLAIDKSNNVYVGGAFTSANGVSCTRVAKWNGTTFAALSTGLNGDCNDLILANDGTLYATGNFTTAGGTSVGYIASWNGAVWGVLGTGLNDVGYSLSVAENGILYAVGQFTSAGGLTNAQRIAVWNGSTWASVDHDQTGSPVFLNVATDGDDLYLGSSYLGTSYYSYLNTVTHNGTARAYPKMIFQRDGGESARLEYIKNEDTGATLWLNYDFQDGERLTIDCTPGARNLTSSYWGDSWRGLLRGSDFADFYLLPGANRISAYLYVPAGSDAPTLTQYFLWRETYWSLDGSA